MEKNLTKELILHAGIKLFAKNAYADVSVDSIVESAGISKGAFYYYFKSKDEFYRSILAYAFENLINLYNDNSKNLEFPEDKLYAFVRAIFLSFKNDKNLFFIIHKELVKITAGEDSDFLDYQNKIFELLKDILRTKEDIVCYIVMGILRSSIIYHLRTSEPLMIVQRKAWEYIKKVLGWQS
ncbi:MAG: TetR/AcrR family transcriptional regulator [Proteobacteria bacterium]|nr:TetR/AcrR family transcriptional regulator [Pseudomonadota bacterium]